MPPVTPRRTAVAEDEAEVRELIREAIEFHLEGLRTARQAATVRDVEFRSAGTT
jgi:predicted RNase H-like HicB family nuclease